MIFSNTNASLATTTYTLMYNAPMSDAFLETFFQIAILPHYNGALDFGDIKWFSHGKIGPDTWAHYFLVTTA
jgi:hypothetical protein